MLPEAVHGPSPKTGGVEKNVLFLYQYLNQQSTGLKTPFVVSVG